VGYVYADGCAGHHDRGPECDLTTGIRSNGRGKVRPRHDPGAEPRPTAAERRAAEPPAAITIRACVESCESLSLDSESDREVLIARLCHALGVA